MKRVAVIGCGASGLVALRWLCERGCWEEVWGFEMSGVVGGTWVYTPEENSMDLKRTAMYENLRTNLPKECMGFLNEPFPKNLPSFIGHENVREYLESYAKRHDLHKRIHFHSRVTNVIPSNMRSPLTCGYTIAWEDHTGTSIEKKQMEFDHLVVCNGHYNTPFIPSFDGIHNFKGKILHSKKYKTNKEYKGKRVVVVGNGASASDIGFEIAEVALEVHHCKRASPSLFNFESKSIISHPNISHITNEGDIVLEDQSILRNIDSFIYCTGFHYDFPFLDEERNKISMEYKRVCDLYQHIFPINEHHPQFHSQRGRTIPPTIAFIGLPWKIIPFPLFDCQARFISRIWADDSCHLPSVEEMKDSIRETIHKIKEQGAPEHYLHCLGFSQFDYCRTLLQAVKEDDATPLIDEVEIIAMATGLARGQYPDSYKNLLLTKDSDGNWVYVEQSKL